MLQAAQDLRHQGWDAAVHMFAWVNQGSDLQFDGQVIQLQLLLNLNQHQLSFTDRLLEGLEGSRPRMQTQAYGYTTWGQTVLTLSKTFVGLLDPVFYTRSQKQEKQQRCVCVCVCVCLHACVHACVLVFVHGKEYLFWPLVRQIYFEHRLQEFPVQLRRLVIIKWYTDKLHF